MDGFIDLFSRVIIEAGIDGRSVFRKKALDLPGYFRPTKQWDLLVVKDGLLIVALEAKSQVGPSLGNNFNNRTEEAMGSALDLSSFLRKLIAIDSARLIFQRSIVDNKDGSIALREEQAHYFTTASL